jgi:C4-dicarboxylate-specific signal transduction histidine kinase
MGELTAAIAHELKQPLTAILTNARVGQRLLAIEPPDLDEVVGALEDVVTGTERSRDLLIRLGDLVRRGEITRETLDLNETLWGIESIIRAETKLAGVTLEFALEDDIPPVDGDRIQLQQVLINLVQNGVAAMNDRELKPRLIIISSTFESDSRAVVAVRDHGPPVNDETVRKMFDPFFSTKREGLGMGLSICQTMIEAHGGNLWAEHNPEGGLTVKFALPVEEAGQ